MSRLRVEQKGPMSRLAKSKKACRAGSTKLSAAGPTLAMPGQRRRRREGRMRFIHTADWQLGMTRHFLNSDAQPHYSAARRDAVSALGPPGAETGAEFV